MSIDMRQRFAADGSSVGKLDPGTQDTDPEYYASTFTVEAVGITTATMTWHTDPMTPAYLQSTIIQIKGAEFGDKMRLGFASDGTQPAVYGPDGYVVKNFGWMNVPLGAYANGWSERLEEPSPKVVSAKIVPPGLVPVIEYDSVSTATKQVAIDLIAQE